MAIKIIKEANKKNPIYFRHCDRCGCEFELGLIYLITPIVNKCL